MWQIQLKTPSDVDTSLVMSQMYFVCKLSELQTHCMALLAYSDFAQQCAGDYFTFQEDMVSTHNLVGEVA